MTGPELTTVVALPGWAHTDAVLALDWSPDGRALSMGVDGALRVDGMPGAIAGVVEPVAAGWAGVGRLACGTARGVVSMAGSDGVQDLSEIDPPVVALRWTGDRLVVAAGARLHVHAIPTDARDDAAPCPTGRATADPRGALFDASFEVALDLGPLRAIELITRAYLVAVGADGVAFVDVGLGLVDVRLTLEGGIAVAADPAGRAVAIGCLDGSIHLLTLGREDDGHELTGYPDLVRHLAWTAGERGIAAASDDEITFWSVDDAEPAPEPRTAVAHDQPITALSASPVDPLFATGDAAGRICLWSPRDLTGPVWTGVTCPTRPVGTDQGPGGSENVGSEITALAWAPDGGALAAGDVSGTVALWTITAGHIV